MVRVTKSLLRAWPLPTLPPNADKEDRGHILVVAGSSETPGAAVLAALAAMRVGAGKLVVCTPASIAPSLAAQLPEARVIALATALGGGISARGAKALRAASQTADAILCGPGMIDSKALREFVMTTVKSQRRLALVLDAAALGAVNELANVPLRDPPFGVITPHAGEMARLVAADRRSIEDEPASFACRLARKANVVVVLKGAVTIIAHPTGPAWKHVGHAIGLGTSGSGDVLAGVISGLATRGATLNRPPSGVWRSRHLQVRR